MHDSVFAMVMRCFCQTISGSLVISTGARFTVQMWRVLFDTDVGSQPWPVVPLSFVFSHLAMPFCVRFVKILWECEASNCAGHRSAKQFQNS